MTAFLVVRVGNEAVTVATVEPHDTATQVVYRPGTRHPLDRRAPGLALLMPEAPRPTTGTHYVRSATRAGPARTGR
jgi:DNA-binding IclR family transcriptional regulator